MSNRKMRCEINPGRKDDPANEGTEARREFRVGELLFYGSEAQTIQNRSAIVARRGLGRTARKPRLGRQLLDYLTGFLARIRRAPSNASFP